MQEEFKISEDESYIFVKETGDYPLLIIHGLKGPGRFRHLNIQIAKSCVPKLKEFINSDNGKRVGVPAYYVDECKHGKDTYHFKRTVDELTEKITEEITIYWISDTIDHVDIDSIAIPALRKFLDENF